MKSSKYLLPLLLAASLGLTACGGGGANVTATSTTMGQELQDLEESREKGLLTDKEYDSARKAILKRYK